MKVNEKTIRRYIRNSLLSEIVALETGSTDFMTTKYEQCPQIKIPPIFRELYLDKMYGEKPEEMRSNLARKYTELTEDKQKAVLFATTFSDENIETVMAMLSDFINVTGIPAMFCKFLQKAIDAAAEMINLLNIVDQTKDESKIDDPGGIFRLIVRDAINAASRYNLESKVDDRMIRYGTAAGSKDDYLRKLKINTTEKFHPSSKAHPSTLFTFLPSTSIVMSLAIKQGAMDPNGTYHNDMLSDELNQAYTTDFLTWKKVQQSLSNLTVLPRSGRVDDQPNSLNEVIDNLMDVIRLELASTSSFPASNLGTIFDPPSDMNSIHRKIVDHPRYNELVTKLSEESNRKQNLQNERFKETFATVIQAMFTANKNYILFDLPVKHGDISKLGREKFYNETRIPNTSVVIRNIALSD